MHHTIRRAVSTLAATTCLLLGLPSLAAAGPAAAPSGQRGQSAAGVAGRSTTTPASPGYWVAHRDGTVTPIHAAFYGDLHGFHLNRPIVATAGTSDGRGYWLVGSDGGVFDFGTAGFHGSAGGIHLNQSIVGMASTPDGRGYWLVAADGGIFDFGDAGFYGSTGNVRLNKPIVGMASTPDGRGYWLVAADGGIFDFGDAGFYGSTGNVRLNKPIVGMASTPDGRGYWMAGSDGGVFDFGDAPFRGSLGGTTQPTPVVGIAEGPATAGYWLVEANGAVFPFGVPSEGSAVGATASPAVGMSTTVDGRAVPHAVDDAYTVITGTTLNVAAPGVLGNDALNGATLTSSTKPAHGSLALATNGSFTYIPTATYVGPDTFTYTIANAAGSSTGTVAVTDRGNPIARPDSYQFAAGRATTEPAATGVLANDLLNGAAITAHTSPSHGAVTLAASGSFTYTPVTGYTGADNFTYTLANPSGSSTATVTLAVVAAPTAVADSYQVPSGGTTSIPAPGVEANDAVNQAAITVTTNPAHGSVTLNQSGSFSYTPTSGYSGADSFGYTLTNAAGTSSATVTLSVVNAPVAVDDTYQVAAGQVDAIAAPGVLANDTVNGGSLSVTTQPANGTVTLDQDGSFTYTSNGGFAGSDSFTYKLTNAAGTSSATVTLSVVNTPVAVDDSYAVAGGKATSVIAANGVLANDTVNGATLAVGTGPTDGALVLNADGSFTYTPNAGLSGADSFTYTLTNAAGASTGTVTLTVEAAPLAVDDSYAVAGGKATSVIAANGVLANDTVNGATLAVGTNPADGTLALNPDGSFTYTPNAGFSGADSFTYTLTNLTSTATATVNLTVEAAPVAVDDSYTVAAAQATSITAANGVLANDTVNGAALALGTGPAHGNLVLNADGSFTYTPIAGFSGADSFTYTLTNLTTTSTATVSLTVDAAPTVSITPADGATGVLATTAPTVAFSKPVTVTAGGFALACGGSAVPFTSSPASPAGQFTLTPSSPLPAGTSCTVTVSASQVTDAAGFPPSADATSTFTVDTPPAVTSTTPANGATGVAVGSTVNVAFSEAVDITASTFALACPTGTPEAVTVSPSAPGGVASYTLTPSSSLPYSTACTVTVTAAQVSDLAGTPMGADFSSTFTTAAPPVPTAAPHSYTGVGNTLLVVGGTAPAGQAAVTVAGTLTTGSTNPGGGTLTAAIGTSPAHGSVSIASDGTFTYEPTAGYRGGTDSFTYTLTSGGQTSAPATVGLTLSGEVWYVDAAASAGGDGRSTGPLKTVGAAAGDATTSGDIVFVRNAAAPYSGSVALAAGVHLWGEPHGLTVAGIPVVPAAASGPGTTSPVLTAPSGNVLTVASADDVQGLGLGTSGSGATALAGIGLTSITIGTATPATTADTVTVNNPAGPAVSLAGSGPGTPAAIILASASGTGGTNGLAFTNLSGTLSIGGGTITGSTGDGVALTSVSGLSLTGLTVTGSGVNGINISGLSGTNTFTNLNIPGALGTNSDGITATTSGTASLSVVNPTLGSGSGFNDDGIYALASGSGNLTLTVSGGTISSYVAKGVQVQSSGAATVTSDVETTTFTRGAISVANEDNATGTFTATVNGITFNGTGAAEDGILSYAGSLVGAGGSLHATITNNRVLYPAYPAGNANADGIVTTDEAAGHIYTLIHGNTVTNAVVDGIDTEAGGTGTSTGGIDATVTSNTVTMANDPVNGLDAVYFLSGGTPGDTDTMCADFKTNTVTDAVAGVGGVNLSVGTAAAGMRLPGYTGASNGGAVAAFEQGQNTFNGDGPVVSEISTNPGFTGGVSGCTQP